MNIVERLLNFVAVLPLLVASASCPVSFTAEPFAYWPDAEYDARIPTVEQVVGHKSGHRITWPHDVIRYFNALRDAAPDRVVIKEYARSWERRPLIYVAISSRDNIARLDAIAADMNRLAEPSGLADNEADDLIKTLPGSVWLAYGVHGNEVSSTDAAMMAAYHLLAAENDPRTVQILENTVVFIDPMQNPDGRARFVHNFEIAEGLEADSDPYAAEHDEPWPGGRTNHYLFDMNRDWIVLTQPETRGRIAALLEYFPLVFVDLHEMGSNATYYFAPEAVPYNPHLAADQRASLELFGRNNAKWFDHFGLDYFTREIFDAFYPGYGASWPSYYGSVAMTYEQASARGLKMRKRDGTEFDFRDTVRNHFITSLSTAEVTSDNREKFLRDFINFRRSAIEEGRSSEPRTYIIPVQNDQSGARKLATLLAAQGVEVKEADRDFDAGGNPYSKGSFIIDLAQPAKRLVRTLLDERVSMEKNFIAEQERRRGKNLPDEIYDVTGWSLPLMFNVEIDACDHAVEVNGTMLTGNSEWPGVVTGAANASVAYLVPWGSTAAGRLLSAALMKGLTVKSADKAFILEGRKYSGGTLIFAVADNSDELGAQVALLAHESGAEVVGVNTSWVTEGPSFGSGKVVNHSAPRVAIAWDRPTGSYSAGNARFVIERQFDYPVSAIRVKTLTDADLSRFDVLILPEDSSSAGGYSRYLDKKAIGNLTRWIEAGGVLITLGKATAFLANPETALLSIRRQDAYRKEDSKSKDSKSNGSDPGNQAKVDGSKAKIGRVFSVS